MFVPTMTSHFGSLFSFFFFFLLFFYTCSVLLVHFFTCFFLKKIFLYFKFRIFYLHFNVRYKFFFKNISKYKSKIILNSITYMFQQFNINIFRSFLFQCTLFSVLNSEMFFSFFLFSIFYRLLVILFCKGLSN